MSTQDIGNLSYPEWRCWVPPTPTPGQRINPLDLNGYYVRAPSAEEACAYLARVHQMAFLAVKWKEPLVLH